MAPDNGGMDKSAKEPANAEAERTDLFEEFTRPSQPGEKPKPKGLNAAGYKFPPDEPLAMTKANIAKGLGQPNQAPAAPLPELKDANSMFETYERPDLDERPRTGPGLRPPQPKSAKEILADYQPPVPQIFTSKRDRPRGADQMDSPESDAAHLDAEADLAVTKGAVMSNPRQHGPTKVQTAEDPLKEMPRPAAHASPPPQASSTARNLGSPHASGAPAVTPGDGPRIAIVQADFNFEITTRMADEAKAAAKHFGANIVHHVHVSGVYDIPLLAKALSKRSDVEAIVVVGCVIQGETAHDQVIAHECARKLSDLSYDSEKPVGFAVSGPRMTRQAAEARIPIARHAVEAVVKQWRALKAVGAARQAAQ